ncbi:MAG: biotin transporter BioY [Candidatus Desulforudis sp.]|nr:biotin transporter BioY [Desulforudis sp.]
MRLTAVANAGSRTFQWCEELSLPKKLALAVVFAALLALAAQIRLPVPWSPVPVTGQTFVVLLAGVLLGRSWGGFSVGLYVGAGVLGAPVFAGMAGGLAYLAGPTGGYLVGFVLAAMFVGYAVRRFTWLRGIIGLAALMLFADFVILFGPGLLYLGYLTGATLSEVLWMGLIPFIVGDVTKVLAAAAIASVLLPRES